MKNELEKLSYSLGLNIAQSLKQQGLDEISGSLIGQAIDDMFNGTEPKIDQEEAGAILNDHFGKLEAKKHEGAIKVGDDFLAANSKNEGVTTLESGLQYEILNEGEGAKPSIDSKVLCHYHGTLLDGTIFDSSVQRGEPISFPVNGVIPGWTEALQLMSIGSKLRLFIPSNLAYGDRGAGQAIPPFSTLIFEVELLEIQ